MRYEKNRSIQEAIVAANDEILQLKATARALRNEMERSAAAFEDRLADERLAHGDELKQLREMIQMLRESLTVKQESTGSL